MGDPSCNFDFLWPGGNDCSGLGACVVSDDNRTEECVCGNGYDAIGDFALQPVDCDQSQVVLYVLHVLAAVAILVAVLLFFIELYQRRKKRKYGNSIFRILVFMQTSAISALVLSLLKIIPEKPQIIGKDVAISIFYISAGTFFWIAAVLLGYNLRSLIVANRMVGLTSRPVIQVPRWVIAVLIVLTYPAPTILCLVNPENSLEYARMFYFGDALLILVGVTYSIYACMEVQKTIDAVLGKTSERRELMYTGGREEVMEEMRETRRRMSSFIVSLKSLVVEALLISFLGFWPYLLRKVGYVFVLMELTSVVTGVYCARVLAKKKKPIIPAFLRSGGRPNSPTEMESRTQTLTDSKT